MSRRDLRRRLDQVEARTYPRPIPHSVIIVPREVDPFVAGDEVFQAWEKANVPRKDGVTYVLMPEWDEDPEISRAGSGETRPVV